MSSKKEIAIVGGGLLGSIFTDCLISHLHSIPTNLYISIIDHDKLENRNCVGNHAISPEYIDSSKAKLLARRFSENGFVARPIVQRLSDKNGNGLLSKATIVIGAVDNVDARINIWHVAHALEIPYLDMGVNTNNFVVSWSYKDVDNMPYSPLINQEPKKIAEVKKPACELIGTRIQAAMAAELAAKSLMIFLHGADPSMIINSMTNMEAENGQMVAWSGIMAAGEISIRGFYLGRREHEIL